MLLLMQYLQTIPAILAFTVFTAGTQIGTGSYVVFNGTANADTIFRTWLYKHLSLCRIWIQWLWCIVEKIPGEQSRPYQFYRFTTGTGYQCSREPGKASTSAIIGWTNGSEATNALLLMKTNAPVDAIPVNLAYTATAAFGSGSTNRQRQLFVFSGSETILQLPGWLPGQYLSYSSIWV